ncbi:MAG: hypothetical protein MUP71_05275 [Candidatus Aminicenantes bacterium]|nr:hypothetical protein [Candidatus Aminicenantes bacterium]
MKPFQGCNLKTHKVIVILLLLFSASGCALIRPQTKHRIFTSEKYFHLGEKLPDNILNVKSRLMTLAYSAQMLTCYRIVCKGILFDYGVNEKGVVEFIATEDVKFRTQNGYAVKTSYGEISEVLKVTTKCEPGWAYYIQLDEGWSIGFVIGHYVTERPPKDDDRITFFFQRK